MIAFTLPRLEQTAFATFGQLVDEERNVICLTLEPAWRENEHDVSCIPAGAYVARRFHSPKRGYDVFMLENVPNREAIELHVGNTSADTEGCILLGSNLGTVNGQPGITGSAAAFRRFMDRMQGVDTFTLTITDPPLITH